MTVYQIADRLAAYCRNEQFSEAQRELYAEDAVSIEPVDTPGFDRETKGLHALREKDEKFNAMVEARHGSTVSEPLVAGNAFCFVLTMDLTLKGGDRQELKELCVYTVKEGKIVSEQFFM